MARAAAIAFALLLAASAVVLADAPARDAGAFYADHIDGVRLQSWLVLASSVPGALLAGLVSRRLRGPAGVTYAIAAATALALVTVGVLLRLGLARNGDASVADVEVYWGPLATFPIALQAGLVAWFARPHWVAGVSAVLAVEQIIESATIFGTGGLFEPGGTLNTAVGPLIYLVWIISLGFWVDAEERLRQAPA